MRKYTDEIEKNANLLLESTLQNLFREANLKLRSQEHNKEKGIDFTFEIETRDDIPVSIGWFILQNKGSETKVTVLKKGENQGKISFQLEDIRHIEYFCQQVELPFILTLCDLSSGTIYWQALQLETDNYIPKVEQIITEMDSGKRKGKTIQIYLDPQKTLLLNNKHCIDNFKLFLNEIEKSKDYILQRNYQNYYYERIDAIAEIIVYKSAPILDQLHTYLTKRFEHVAVLPHSFWALMYPFKVGKSAYFEYSLFTLYTDNTNIYDFIESVTIIDKSILQFNDPKFIVGVKDYEKKTKTILRILNQNLVFNIALASGNKRKEISYFENINLSSIDYCYGNLRLDKVINFLTSASEKSNEELESLAYLQYEIGNYNESARIYLKLFEGVNSMSKYPKKFIYAYNLSKLEPFVKYRFSNEADDSSLLTKLKKVKSQFELQTTNFSNDSKLTRWIKEKLFFWDFQSDMQDNALKLRDFYFLTLNGGFGSNSLIWSIYVHHAMFISFINANKIIVDAIKEMDQANDLFAECMILSHSIHDSMYSRLETFDDWIVKALILYCKPDSILKYITRYNIKSIKYTRNTLTDDGFMDLARNFFHSASSLTSDNGWKNSFDFPNKFRNILGNIITLSSYLDLPDEQYQEIAELMLHFFNYPIAINYPLEVKYVNRFLVNRSKLLDKNKLNNYFKLFLKSSKFHNDDFLYSLVKVSEDIKEKIEINNSDLEVLFSFFDDKCKICNQRHDASMLVSIFRLVKNNDTNQLIKEKIEYKLKIKFDWRLYYVSAIYEVLGIDNYFFKQLINMYEPSGQILHFGGHYTKDQKNRDGRLGAIINICFKYKVDFKSDEFAHFKGFDPYYDWLMDMDNFDYSLFNPRWITEYSTTYYLDRISKVKKVMKEVAEYLNQTQDPLVTKLFIQLNNRANI